MSNLSSQFVTCSLSPGPSPRNTAGQRGANKLDKTLIHSSLRSRGTQWEEGWGGGRR